MSFRVMIAAVVMGALLVVGAGPAVAKKRARVYKHRGIVALAATGGVAHQHWRSDDAFSRAISRQGFVGPFATGFKCQVYIGYATNNNPTKETTFDSVQQGFEFLFPGGTVGLLTTTCQGTIPSTSVVHPGDFTSPCFQPNQFPTGPTTIEGQGSTTVFADGGYRGTCNTTRVPFS